MKQAALLCLAALTAPPAAAAEPPHFDAEIVPVLTTAGCNAGSCHGAAAGRGGLRLSLLGADPDADYESIVHEFEGRRIHRVRPEWSLLVAKPTGQLDHGGGEALAPDGHGAALLQDWIAAGAPRGAPRRLVRFAADPPRFFCDAAPASVTLRVFAEFDDGASRDVTSATLFTSVDPASVALEGSAAQVLRPGRHVIVARFLDRVLPIQVSVPFRATPLDFASAPRANYIDEFVLSTLEELRIPPSPPADDAAWLRRVTLDLTGRLPAPAEVAQFHQDADPERRAAYVDRLLASPAFETTWTLFFARLLQIHSLPNETAGLHAYVDWLRAQIRQGAGLDRVAFELITATGDAHHVGPANFGRMAADARNQAELFGQAFLGVRLDCANCHDHPLDRWKQDDYHGLAAVFARLDRGRHVQWTNVGAVAHPRTGEPAPPRIPGLRNLPTEGDPRPALAAWLVADPQRYFARATVNRLWAALFGRGLVEPVDDLRETSPPTHPELLSRLADDFISHDYDFRHILRTIALSETYARSDSPTPGNERDDRFYARAYRRPLPPEALADAIADVTGVPLDLPGAPSVARAVEVVDPLATAPALDVLGRCNRAAGCDVGASTRGLATQLHLLNGELLNARIAAPEGFLHQQAAAGRTNGEIVADFYQRAFCREPTATEQQAWEERLDVDDPAERLRRLEDFVWSLLSSAAFQHNY